MNQNDLLMEIATGAMKLKQLTRLVADRRCMTLQARGEALGEYPVAVDVFVEPSGLIVLELCDTQLKYETRSAPEAIETLGFWLAGDLDGGH